MSAQAVTVGQRVLDGFTKGRALAIQQAKARSARHAAEIIPLYLDDLARDKPTRGRAGRIKRRMANPLSESQIRKILRPLISARELPRSV